jgi:hypothetical protein
MGGDFSWKRAVFAGFGMLRREPRVVLPWGAVGLVFAFAEQALEVVRANSRSGTWTLPLLGLVQGVVLIIATATFSAAVYRVMLRPESETRGRMRFGRDEIRLTLIWLLQGAALVVLLGAAIVLVAAVSMQAPNSSGPGDLIFLGVATLVALIGWSALVARLALAAPMTLVEGQWSVPEAWRLTRGHAWKIAGVHIPLVIALALTFTVGKTLYQFGAYAIVPGFTAKLLSADKAWTDLFHPARLVFMILNGWLGAAAAVLLYAPAAVIYRDLKGVDPNNQAAVFD